MGLIEIAVGIANNVTKNLGLQASVLHQFCPTESGAGSRNLGAPVARDAIVVLKQQMVKNPDGQMVMAQARITLLDPTVQVTLLDKFTLPDGTSGPVLAIEGFVSQGADRPALTQVWLG